MLLMSRGCLHLLIILFDSVHLSITSCIASLQVEHISSTRATLSWASKCNSSGFKISWSHQQFLACENNDKYRSEPVDILTKIVNESSRVLIDGLQPYSTYNFSVQDLCSNHGDHTVTASTEESIPQVVTRPIYDYSLDSSGSLLFRWVVPGQSQCAHYQARLGYLFFKLVGRVL